MSQNEIDKVIVYFDNGDDCGRSKIYCVDPVRERFLVLRWDGKFLWVSISDCEVENIKELRI